MSADSAGDMLVARQKRGRIKLPAGRGQISGSLLLLAVIVLFAFPLVSMILAPLRQPGLPPPHGLELRPQPKQASASVGTIR